MTPAQALDFVKRHGIVCESARRGTIPSLADAIAGEILKGNWWSHPKSREIFAITRALRASPQVLVCRLIESKITFVHERLWPALTRAANRLPTGHLARVREVHSESGKHVLEETAFPDWVPPQAVTASRGLTESEALATLGVLPPEDS